MAVSTPNRRYLVTAIVILVVTVTAGILISNLLEIPEPQPVEGVTVFAILYVLAQSIERVSELVFKGLDMALNIGKEEAKAVVRKAAAISQLRALSVPAASAPLTTAQAATTAAATTKADEAKNDTSVVALALSFGLAWVAISYFNFSLLASIGFETNRWLDALVTAVAIMGGSAGLHDLLGKIQKSKEKDEKTA